MAISISGYRGAIDLMKNGFKKISGSLTRTGEEVYKFQNGTERVYAFVKDGKIMPRQIKAHFNNSIYEHEKLNWNTKFMGGQGTTTEKFSSLSNVNGLAADRTLIQESPAGKSRVYHAILTNPDYKVKYSRFDKNVQQKSVYSTWNDVPSTARLVEDSTVINHFDKGFSLRSGTFLEDGVSALHVPFDAKHTPTFKSFEDTLKNEYLFYKN